MRLGGALSDMLVGVPGLRQRGLVGVVAGVVAAPVVVFLAEAAEVLEDMLGREVMEAAPAAPRRRGPEAVAAAAGKLVVLRLPQVLAAAGPAYLGKVLVARLVRWVPREAVVLEELLGRLIPRAFRERAAVMVAGPVGRGKTKHQA